MDRPEVSSHVPTAPAKPNGAIVRRPGAIKRLQISGSQVVKSRSLDDAAGLAGTPANALRKGLRKDRTLDDERFSDSSKLGCITDNPNEPLGRSHAAKHPLQIVADVDAPSTIFQTWLTPSIQHASEPVSSAPDNPNEALGLFHTSKHPLKMIADVDTPSPMFQTWLTPSIQHASEPVSSAPAIMLRRRPSSLRVDLDSQTPTNPKPSDVDFCAWKPPTPSLGDNRAVATGSSIPMEKHLQHTCDLDLTTPQSCKSSRRWCFTPSSPYPDRATFKTLSGKVDVVFFDFDGTLTATPGNLALCHSQKSADLRRRATLLAHHLQALYNAGVLLGIISKSTEVTITSALEDVGLRHFFVGPIIGKAVGLEGKVGFIADLLTAGKLAPLRNGDDRLLERILLVDDDMHELEWAIARGMQTFPAPEQGGLQDEDFNCIFRALGVNDSTQFRSDKLYLNPSATDILGA